MSEEIIAKIDENTNMLRQEMKDSISAVRQEMTENTNMLRQEMKDNISTLKQELEQKIEKNTEDIKDIKEILKEHSRALIIIEDAVTNKIPALFDKLSSHDDRFERDEERLEKIEKVTESNTNRITALELTTTGIQNN